MTVPSSSSLPFAIASTVGPPRRPSPTKGGRGANGESIADRLKTSAPQAALRGEYGRALDLYRTLAALEPTVPLHRIRAGDCLVKLGKKRDALVEYRAAADAYTKMGLVVHARSAWRLVLGIVPGDADATARLAALDARARGAKAGTPPPLPTAAGAIPAPPPPHDAPRTRGGKTPTVSDAEMRAERAREQQAVRSVIALPEKIDDASRRRASSGIDRTALSKAPVMEKIVSAGDLVVTPVVAKRADVFRMDAEDDPSAKRKALGLEPLASGAELVSEDEFCSATGKAFAPAPIAPPAATPSKPKRVEKSRSERAMEFADLDDDADCLWIDLEGIVEAEPSERSPLEFREETGEPVAFFAESTEPGPARQTASVVAPRGSLVDEETKPVPAPDESFA